MRDDSVTHVLAHTAYYGEKVELSKTVLKHYQSCSDCEAFVRSFSLLFYFIFERDLQSDEDSRLYNAAELRNLVISDIMLKSDVPFFTDNLRSFLLNKRELKKEYDLLHCLEKTGRVKWLLTGHSFWYTVLVKIRKKVK